MTTKDFAGRKSPKMEKRCLFDERSVASDSESDADSEATLHSSYPNSPGLASFQYIEKVQPYIRACRVPSWRSTAGQTGFALLPSFLQSRIRHEESFKPEKLYPTAYLDGMRGLAALFVFFCHLSYGCFRLPKGFGYVWDDGSINNYILQLPFIRLFYCGPPMVSIFFVISGYALSLKPLKLMRSSSFADLSTVMSSSIFRRGIRLFLPTMVSTFMVVLLLQFGFYERTRAFAGNPDFFPAIREHHQGKAATFSAQFRGWLWDMFQFVHVWDFDQFGGSTGYDLHLWTIPLEFRASMVLFLLQMGLARVTTAVRWTCLLLFSWFALRNQRWELILFVAGLLLAELDLMRIARRKAESQRAGTSSPLPSYMDRWSGKAESMAKNEVTRKYGWYVVAFVALYLMSTPDEDAELTPGWRYLATWVPRWLNDKYRFWQSIGSIMFVLATNFSPVLQQPFNTAFVQYFGKISYAIYLMHGPVIHTIGYTIMRWSWNITGSYTEEQYVLGFMLSVVFIVPITIWAADLFWRFVDAPVVRFAKWAETACLAGEDDKG